MIRKDKDRKDKDEKKEKLNQGETPLNNEEEPKKEEPEEEPKEEPKKEEPKEEPREKSSQPMPEEEEAPPPEEPTKELGRKTYMQIGKGKRDDFANLVKKFEESAKDSIDSYQESGPREIHITSVYCDSKSGPVCVTDEQGIPNLIAPGVEPGAQRKKVRQRYYMGIQTEAVTKGRVYKTENLRTKKAPKPFDITPQVDQLLKATISPAQDEGDKIQRKIDEENKEYFPVHLTPPEENIVAEDVEPDPDLEMIKDLVAYAYGQIADRLGAKADKIKVQFVKITEHVLYADSLGSRTDLVYPRVSFEIDVTTREGNNAVRVLRGAGGTIKEILISYAAFEDGSSEPKTIISKAIDRVVKEAVDLDRAQTPTVIGASECPVILSAEVAGVLAHEVFGHPAEADIICENRRNKDVGVQLKARIGSQVSDQNLSMIDTPEKEIKIGDRVLKYLWGSLPVDGYGNRGKVAPLIENGTMVGVMVDRHSFNEIIHGLRNPESIKKIGITGNVRREKFDRPPLIRMRTTVVLPDETGPSSKEEMARLIPATKKGLYVKSCHGGSVDTDSGNFQINANLCYLIENRTITEKPIKNVTITGNIKQVGLIKSIGHAKTIDGTFPGWCGKNGQKVPVDGVSPIIYIESARLGGGDVYRPWAELVKDYITQHREVMEGKRGPESIYLPEFREIVKNKEFYKVCLITLVLPENETIRYLRGTDDFSTHETDETTGKLIERRDYYE